jgi:hypothetical protein
MLNKFPNVEWTLLSFFTLRCQMNMEVKYMLNEQINVHMSTYACQI